MFTSTALAVNTTNSQPPITPATRQDDLDFELLTLLEQEPSLTQREIADRLGISLGKINYCLKALAGKGAIKLENFGNSKRKLAYVYVLTPNGIGQRTKLARGFLARKMAEYDRLKAQIEALEGVLAIKGGWGVSKARQSWSSHGTMPKWRALAADHHHLHHYLDDWIGWLRCLPPTVRFAAIPSGWPRADLQLPAQRCNVQS